MHPHTLIPLAARPKRIAIAGLFIVTGLATAGAAQAQTFNPYVGYPHPEYAGSDGALDLSGVASGTIVNFDPRTEPRLAGKDLDHDNVYHFTTVTIPTGVTIKMSAKWTNGPVYWIASGIPGQPAATVAVNIAGTVELSGETGQNYSKSGATRRPAVPGPGGFLGGLGGNWASGSRGIALAGLGPKSGAGATSADAGRGGSAKVTDNTFLVPLSGGSGGGGGSTSDYEFWGGGGGAGGGALLIASSQAVSVTGRIQADGGWGGCGNACNCAAFSGGPGNGGSIRISAPIVQGNGVLSALYGRMTGCDPGYPPHGIYMSNYGRVRLEAFQHAWTFSIPANYTSGSPLAAFAPTTPPPSLQVIDIDNQAVNPDPTGSFDLADVTIDDSSAVDVTIRGRNVPLGTKPKLHLFSLEGTDQTVEASPLTGSLEESTASATLTFPAGFSRGYVRAVWTTQ